jgi:broad specificity phosphatase PhoE
MNTTTITNNHLSNKTTVFQNTVATLRHGQSQANVARMIASDPAIACTNYGLTATGHQQATHAGIDVVDYYQKQPTITGIVVVSSDFLRAQETAQAVKNQCVAHNIPHVLKTDKRLRERWFGEYDMTSDSNYALVWKQDAVDANHTMINVESVNSVMQRVTDCVCDYDERYQNHLIVCVAHGDVLQILQTAFQRLDGAQHRSLEHLETAQLRVLEFKEAKDE